MPPITTKHTNKLTLIINIILYALFGLLIIIFGLCEGLCINAVTETISDSSEEVEQLLDSEEAISSSLFDTQEAKFYINNLVIIICPFVDSIVGIAFAAYKDKVYGFTISDLKEMSRYSGFSFVEIILISVVSIILAIVCYYTNLFYTSIIVNAVLFVYTLIFVFTDVSLIARAKWRIRGIYKYCYKQNQNNANDQFIFNVILLFSSHLSSVVDYMHNQTKKEIKLSDYFINAIEDFYSDCSNETSEYSKMFRKILYKNRKKFVDLENDVLYKKIRKVLVNVIFDSYRDKHQILAFSPSKQQDLLQNFVEFTKCLYNRCLGGDRENVISTPDGLSYLVSISFKDFCNPEVSYFDLNCKLLVANMTIKDGLMATMKCLNMETINDVVACINCQRLFLGDVISCDMEYIEQYMNGSQENIKNLINYHNDKDDPAVAIVKSGAYDLAKALSQAILNLKQTADKYQDESEKSIDFMDIVKSCLPFSDSGLGHKIIKDETYKLYYYNLSTLLLINSLEGGYIWYYEYLNDLFTPNSLSSLMHDSDFYIFATVYLFSKYQNNEIDSNLKKEIDSKLKKKMKDDIHNLFRIIFVMHRAESTSNLLISILKIHSVYTPQIDFTKSLDNVILENRLVFDDEYLFKWWFGFICLYGMNYTKEDLLSLKTEFLTEIPDLVTFGKPHTYWSLYKEAFYGFYADVKSTDRTNIRKSLSYFKYFDYTFTESSFSNALNSMKQDIIDLTKDELLSTKNLTDQFLSQQSAYIKSNVTRALKKFTLYSEDINGKKSFKCKIKQFSEIIDIDTLARISNSRAECGSLIYSNFINDSFNAIKKEMLNVNKNNVVNFNKYKQEDINNISSHKYQNRFINLSNNNNANGNGDSLNANCKLNAKQYIYERYELPYDIFFKNDAIKMNFEFTKIPTCKKLTKAEALKLVEEKYGNLLEDGSYKIKIPTAKNNDFFMMLSKDEFATLLMNRCVKLQFSIETNISLKPNQILIYNACACAW